jgi:hypothetical protein
MDATAADPATADKAGAAYMLMLATRLQRELSESWRQANASSTPLKLLALDTEFGFSSAADRARFAQALSKAITTLVSEHTTPADRSVEGRYRMVLGCYPIPE